MGRDMQQKLSLYIALEPSRNMDLEAAAKAAIAFNSLIKEIAFVIDPFATVRVELKSGTEGSLSLNSVVRGVTGVLTKERLAAIALGACVFVGEQTASWAYAKFMDSIWESETAPPEDLELIMERLITAPSVQKEVRRLYQELQRDDAVTGVGICGEHDTKPGFIVPRSEFSERGLEVKETEAELVRYVTSVQSVTLVSPVLVQGKRKWKFKQGKTEFGAPILDDRFLKRVLSGREPILMSDGITMKVKMTTKEHRLDGVVWEIVERSIDEVIEVILPPTQTHFLMTPEDTQRIDDD